MYKKNCFLMLQLRICRPLPSPIRNGPIFMKDAQRAETNDK